MNNIDTDLRLTLSSANVGRKTTDIREEVLAASILISITHKFKQLMYPIFTAYIGIPPIGMSEP